MSSGSHRNLFRLFREDHAVLGRGFHRLSERLRTGDDAGARAAARELDRDAGAHIAFEEEDFYPRLVPELGEAEVERLYRDHAGARDLVQALLADEAPLDEARRRELLARSEAMETHIAECGELFQALARLDDAEQDRLERRLEDWRRRRPRWSERPAAAPSPD